MAVARNAMTTRGREGEPAAPTAEAKRTGANHATPEPGAKTIIDETANGVISKAKKMWGIMRKPEYVHVDGGFGALVAPGVFAFAVQGKSFADEAYTSPNPRRAIARERDTLRPRVKLGEN